MRIPSGKGGRYIDMMIQVEEALWSNEFQGAMPDFLMRPHIPRIQREREREGDRQTEDAGIVTIRQRRRVDNNNKHTASSDVDS